MKKPRLKLKKPKLAAFEWFLLAVFIVLDVTIFTYGKRYLESRDLRPIEALNPASAQQEQVAMERVETMAKSGSWDSLERVRSQEISNFVDAKVRPSLGSALYFFPEMLPERSLERAFAEKELRQGLQTLRKAYEGQKEQDAQNAFHLLEIRVENYELGATDTTENLSEEARRFLRTYKHFTTSK